MKSNSTYYMVKDGAIVPAMGWQILEVPKNPTTKPTLANYTYVEDQIKWAEEHVSEAVDIVTLLKERE